MHEDSPNTRTAMVLIFMALVVALAAVLFVMIAYGYGEKSGPGGFPSGSGGGSELPVGTVIHRLNHEGRSAGIPCPPICPGYTFR